MKLLLKSLLSNLSFPIFRIKEIWHIFYTVLWSDFTKRKLENAGLNTHIMPGSQIIGGKSISIEDNTFIGSGSILSAWHSYKGVKYNPKIYIGSNVSIGEYNHITAINRIAIGQGVLTGRWVTITDNSHGNTNNDLDIIPSERPLFSKGSVTIGDNVWIGDKVTILPNVNIGKGSIIGANSVVTKDIPPYCIAAGNPAKIIKNLNEYIPKS